MAIEFDIEDLPYHPTSWWHGMVTRMRELNAPSPQLAYYRAHRDDINWRRSKTRPSRAKSGPRVYAGVPVVVRRALRDHIKQLQRARRR